MFASIDEFIRESIPSTNNRNILKINNLGEDFE